MRVPPLAAPLSCLVLLLVPASAQEPGPHAIVRKHSLDPDRPGDEPLDLLVVRGGAEFAVLHGASADLSFRRVSDGEFLARVDLGGVPRRAAVTPDGAKVVVVDRTVDQAIVVDTASRTVVARLALPTVQPIDVLVTPDGQQAVIVPAGSTTGGIVTLVDLATHSVAGSISIPGGGAYGGYSDDSAVLSGDGTRLLLLGSPARVVNLVSGLVEWTAPASLSSAPAGWLSPTGDRALVVTSGAGFAKVLWAIDLAQGTEVELGVLGNNESTTRLTVTDDGQHAVFGSAAGLLFVDVLQGTTTRVSGVRGSALGTTSDRETVVVNTLEEHVVYDVRTGTEISRFPTSWVSPSFACGLGGKQVLVVDEFAERAALFDLDPAAPSVHWTQPSGQGIELDRVRAAQLVESGDLVGVTSGASWNIVFLDPATGRSAGSLEFHRPLLGSAIGGGFALANLGLPGCKGPGEMELWRIEDSSLVGAIPVSECGAAVAVTPSGDFAIATDRPGGALASDLIVIDTADPPGGAGYRVTLPPGVSPIGAVLSPGGRWLAMGDPSTGDWHLFDLSLRQIVQTFVPANREAIAFSGDDERLFVGSNVSGNALLEIDLTLAVPAEVARYPLPSSLNRPLDVEIDLLGERVWVMGQSGLAYLDDSVPGGFVSVIASTNGALLRVLGPHAIVARAGRYLRFFARESMSVIEHVETVDDAAIPAPNHTTGPLLDARRGLFTWADRTSESLFVLDLGSTRPKVHCGASAGNPMLTATGPFVAYGASFDLVASGLPAGTFGFPLIGTGDGQLPLGNGVCIGPPVIRWADRLTMAGASGVLRLDVLPDELPGQWPLGGAGAGVDHGVSLRFQCWFRGDGSLGRGELTNALEVYFR